MKTTINKTIADIKDLKIQGATNVAKEAVKTLGSYSSEKPWIINGLKQVGHKLALARPTEPLARNCINWILDKAKDKEGQSLKNEAQAIIQTLKQAKDNIIKNGVVLVKDNSTILTHCHSSTVTGILRKAHRLGKKFKVYLTETRPRYQGHITAEELVKSGINATMITDSQASFVVSRQDQIKIDFVIVGADAIDREGNALNKVGSYGLSLSAKQAKVPFYVTATVLKFSPFDIPIEIRSSQEVWDRKPDKLKIVNLAFDKIPHNYITSFITEFGLIKPNNIKDIVKKHYPWVFYE